MVDGAARARGDLRGLEERVPVQLRGAGARVPDEVPPVVIARAGERLGGARCARAGRGPEPVQRLERVASDARSLLEREAEREHGARVSLRGREAQLGDGGGPAPGAHREGLLLDAPLARRENGLARESVTAPGENEGDGEPDRRMGGRGYPPLEPLPHRRRLERASAQR